MAIISNPVRYEHVGDVSINESRVEIVRKVSVREPWKNFMKCVEIEGNFGTKGSARLYDGNILGLDRFYGQLILPASRKTSLVSKNSEIFGDHPLGRIQTEGGSVNLREPDYLEGLPKEAKYLISAAIDLGIIGAITGVAHTMSSVVGSSGISGWSPDISLLIGAGANVGIRHRNAVTTALSLGIAGGTIFLPEIFARDTLGIEDLLKVAGTVASGFVGKGIRQIYDNIRD